MRVGYYPGCSLHATSREFDESLRAISGPLDVELVEVQDWSCCGASSAHTTNHLLGVSLPARNLALAEQQGHDQVMAPCAACFNRLASARHEIARDTALAKKISGILGREFRNEIGVRNVVDLLRERIPALKEKVTRPLKGLRVACYYGCLLLRPAEVCQFDDPENPSSMEEVVRATGAEPVSWSSRLVCCGGAFSISRTASVVRLGREILEDARRAGAGVVVVACPMCHSNLDFRQGAMERRGAEPLPVLFISELVGLALGLPPQTLGLARHFVSASALFDRGVAQQPAVVPAQKPPAAVTKEAV
ncbi:MAG: CoB--CoM heterodisulfide reductase iron-sulfur subunit B family protein [Thermoanaerobaculia bacterium]|nr:CoB--CoM heterodisulfide reductase iron-sulfur subunit B family protein [Thermoanaerobaculia bacterium]